MQEREILEKLNAALSEIESIKSDKKCIASPAVKNWKKNVENALEAAGAHCAKNLQSFRLLKFGAPSKGVPLGKNLEDFVNYNNYLIELEAAKKIIESSIKTIKLFGKEEKELPFDWKKKEIPQAAGEIFIGNNKVSINSISMLEVFWCFQQFINQQKAIPEDIKEAISTTINNWRNNPLLSSSFSVSLDKVLGLLQI
jgi:hypothetical protein